MRHARLEEVAQGAWAVIALPDRGAVGNAGILDLGGEALVFDTHFAPGAARELRAAAEELAGPVRTVVNSHWHPDHVRGNGSFPDATVLATTRTRELMATRGEERLRELKNWDEGFEEQARAFRERGLVDELEILEEFVRELPGLEQRLPDEAWEERLDLGRASLLTWGGGHSDSDGVLWLPDDRTVFAADLVFVGRQPWAGDGDPTHWVQILERLDALGVETVVPGHGPVAGPEAFAQLRDYLEALIEAPASMPERFAGLDGAQMWARNRAALEDRSS